MYVLYIYGHTISVHNKTPQQLLRSKRLDATSSHVLWLALSGAPYATKRSTVCWAFFQFSLTPTLMCHNVTTVTQDHNNFNTTNKYNTYRTQIGVNAHSKKSLRFISPERKIQIRTPASNTKRLIRILRLYSVLHTDWRTVKQLFIEAKMFYFS